MSSNALSPADAMRRAIELARRGEGQVEPNPMVGAVVVAPEGTVVGEGFHERFGGPHAEVLALAKAGERARGSTLYVTLEPCCHHGKTPPCVDAVLASGIRRVVVGVVDPNPKVAGGGIGRLRQAGLEVEMGPLESETRRLVAPFRKLVESARPWVHAKWAMTLDGRIASRTGHSQWISNAVSRAAVHRLRGRMDAIVVGIGTALADDPLLTARPGGPRVATRVVVDSQARLPLAARLVATASQARVMVAVAKSAPAARVDALRDNGVEVIALPDAGPGESGGLALERLLDELGRRQYTNILVEGGGRLLGSLFDQQLIDEAHVFIAAKLVGGAAARAPLAGQGLEKIPEGASLVDPTVENLAGDIYIHGRLAG